MNRTQSHAGFTLIEILVAMIILSIGFLGLAALQSTAVRGTQATYFRTQADFLANDMAERMRSNAIASSAGDYEYAGGATSGAICNSASANCDAEDLAAHDLSEWVTWVTEALPRGAAEITQAEPPLWEITLRWDERRNGRNGQGCDPLDENDMACLKLNVEIR